jgi:hypothetical protein
MADEIMRASSEMDAIVPELWSAAFYPTLLEKLPFNSSVSSDYEGEIQALGDVVRIPNIPQFDVAQEIAEDEVVSADSVTVSSQSLTINKQVAKDYILTKKALAQSIDAQNKLRDLALHSIMKKMQLIIIAEIAPSTSAPDHAIAYDSGTTLALADVLEAKELLDNADVEELGRCMILGAAQYNDLFNISGFTSRDYIPAGSPMASGAIATPVVGFEVKWTSEAGSTAYLFHPIFLQMAVQQMPEVKVYDQGVEGKRSNRVNMDVLFGVKQCSNLRVVTIS